MLLMMMMLLMLVMMLMMMMMMAMMMMIAPKLMAEPELCPKFRAKLMRQTAKAHEANCDLPEISSKFQLQHKLHMHICGLKQPSAGMETAKGLQRKRKRDLGPTTPIVHSYLVDVLIELWSWGLIQASVMQKICQAAEKDGLRHPEPTPMHWDCYVTATDRGARGWFNHQSIMQYCASTCFLRTHV
eukprot:8375175-Karenia_brevis.AAC.2